MFHLFTPKGSGIYAIRNTVTKDFYIGSAVDLGERRRRHCIHLRKNIHHNAHLQRAFNKYGENAFVFEIIEPVENREDLIAREQHYIYLLKPQYNILPIAGSWLGHKHTPESRAKMSQSMTGRKCSPRSLEYRAKLGAAHKGKKFSPEHIANMSKSRIGKPSPKRGMPMSESQKAKLSKAHKGKILTPEHRAHIADAGRGRKLNDKQKAALIESNRRRAGVLHTEEHKAKITEGNKRRWERVRAAKEQERIAKEQKLLAFWENIESTEPIDMPQCTPTTLWDIIDSAPVSNEPEQCIVQSVDTGDAQLVIEPIIDEKPDASEKIADSVPENKSGRGMTGKKHSEEAKRKMSEAKKGKPGASKGRKAGEETRAKQRAAKLGKGLAPEHRAKIAEKNRLRQAQARAIKEQEQLAKAQALLARRENIEPSEPIDSNAYTPLTLWDFIDPAS
jgi:group I intron endonuclease